MRGNVVSWWCSPRHEGSLGRRGAIVGRGREAIVAKGEGGVGGGGRLPYYCVCTRHRGGREGGLPNY